MNNKSGFKSIKNILEEFKVCYTGDGDKRWTELRYALGTLEINDSNGQSVEIYDVEKFIKAVNVIKNKIKL